MYCQNCGMLKINCICGKYNKSDFTDMMMNTVMNLISCLMQMNP